MAITAVHTPPALATTRNPVSFQVQASANWRTYADYEIRCILIKETTYRSGTYEAVITISDTPDQQDQVRFDLSSVLESLVRPEPPAAPMFTAPKVMSKAVVIYKAIILEYLPSTASILSTIVFDGHIVNSGLSEIRGQDLASMVSFGRFLSDQPNPKPITQYQPEWLYFGVLGDTTIQVIAKILFEDGSDSGEISGLSLSVKLRDIVQVSSGWEQLNLGNFAGSIAVGYQIWIKDTIKGTILSEIMEYRFDHCQCSPLDRFFLFENSYGGFDTVRTTGLAEVKDSVKGKQALLIPDPTRTGPVRMLFDFNRSRMEETNQHIGILSEGERKWLRHLLLSKDAYRVGKDNEPNPHANGEFIPISIKPEVHTILKDNEFLNELPFQYTEAFVNYGL